jgi:tetratricopeptide (TPR) repeat protein
MKRLSVSLVAVLISILFAISSLPATAQDKHQHEHQHDHGEKLGNVSFPISCAKVQQQFNRAVALLHSFWYEEAEKAFVEITKTQPDCAMGYWGVAMSNYHPIWAPPTPAELARGRTAAEKAVAVGGKTEREKDYIAAIATFYRDSDKLDHRARSLAYEKAMETLHIRHSQDNEAAVFYSLALLGTALPTDKSYANQKKAADILNRVLPKEKDHPGIAHYIIHSFDYPQLAELALPAARVYSKIAPSSPHALHMPTHIFTRLGLWQESIEMNIASADAAKQHVAKTHPGAGSFDQLHAIDYLVYAYLQGAQDAAARRALDEMSRINKLDLENFAAAYAFAAAPARYALERRRWTEAASLNLHPSNFQWKNFPYAEAILYYARAIGAARSGQLEPARRDVEKLASIQKALSEARSDYWATQVEIQRLAAAAWLAKGEGKNDEALKLMRSAADLEDTTEKHPVTPGAVIPARELLADMLIELKKPEQAFGELERSLRNSPNRFNALYAMANAARALGDKEKLKTAYAKLIELCGQADVERPELKEAKSFLSANTK